MNSLYFAFSRFLERHLPAGLFQRALIILVAPVVLIQTIMTGVILDRHWDNVTKVLARSLSRDIAALIEIYEESDKNESDLVSIENLANRQLSLGLEIQRGAALPAPVQAPLFSAVDRRLTTYLTRYTGRPFWIDSTSQPDAVDIRVEVEHGLIFRLLTSNDRAYAAGTDTLLYWMVFSSLILMGIAGVFLRKQISPILDLAKAAKSFGTGRDTGDFRPRGATEVRQAGEAFLDMRDRIARQVEQRTVMLAGVSHDLRTVLTRFRLGLAVLGNGPKVQPLKEDVAEMQRMLEAYIAFVRGDGGEMPESVLLFEVIGAAVRAAARSGAQVTMDVAPDLRARVKPNAFARLLANVVGNAARYAAKVKVSAESEPEQVVIVVDDDGPGIPPDKRSDAFRPFVRLDDARNLDETGTGLGLAIALDIARAHGGDIVMGDSPMGGLRVKIILPV